MLSQSVNLNLLNQSFIGQNNTQWKICVWRRIFQNARDLQIDSKYFNRFTHRRFPVTKIF